MNTKQKTIARDFFLNLGSMISLYAVCISFINLIFKIIDKSYPDLNAYYYFTNQSEISLPVAILIIIFPIFIFISHILNKIYTEDYGKKNLGVRKWLTYITLFISGIIFTGDLIVVLYKFLDGQDLTLAFILKAITILGVTGVVFGYYISEIKDHVSNKSRRIYTYISTVLIITSIILGFAIIGSPKTQRLIREDGQKIEKLQNMQWQVINYWQTNGSIPKEFGNSEYEYKKTSELNFEICTTFNSEKNNDRSYQPEPYLNTKMGIENDNWSHSGGYHCFKRVINPIFYPTNIRG